MTIKINGKHSNYLRGCFFIFLVTACKQESESSSMNSNRQEAIKNPDNYQGKRQPNSDPSQQITIKVPAEAKFAGSCMGYMRIFDSSGTLSPTAQNAYQLLMTIIINKKSFKCVEFYNQTLTIGSTTVSPEKIEAYRNTCLSDQSFATPLLMLDKRCSAPEVGFQELYSVQANFGTETRVEHLLNSVNFIGLSAQDTSTLKSGIKEIYGPENGSVKRSYTSHFK